MRKKQEVGFSSEIAAIDAVYKALEGLPQDSRERVLSYVARALKIESLPPEGREASHPVHYEDDHGPEATYAMRAAPKDPGGEIEGISPVARKWMTRNGLEAKALSAIFSLGVDEIDLIAKDVPGKSKKDRTHSVLLLKGVAAYLGSGVARVTHEQIKEACLHYRAFDANNFAAYLKSFSADVSGDKSTGYALTARGLSDATEKVKAMSQQGTA